MYPETYESHTKNLPGFELEPELLSSMFLPHKCIGGYMLTLQLAHFRLKVIEKKTRTGSDLPTLIWSYLRLTPKLAPTQTRKANKLIIPF